MQYKILQQVSLILAACGQHGLCSPQQSSSRLSARAADEGSFASPPASVRPRFRYWIPDALVDLPRLTQDISDAGAVGAGGVQVLGFYLYGATPGTYVPVDWATYGWGTPAWKKVLDTAIQAHRDNGLLMDFAMGPNQGQGVPAKHDDEGLMWDLRPSTVFVSLGVSFNDTIPGWGTGKLQAVVTGLITKEEQASGPEPSLPNSKLETRTQYTLSTASLQVVTEQVTQDGQLKTSFPRNQTGLQNVVYAVYLVRSGAPNQEPPHDLKGPQSEPQTYVQNGSWVVDHFSAAGAKVMTDFWETHLLSGGTKELLKQAGRYAWEDSIEINPNVYWTPGLPKAFEERRGYSLTKYFPVLFHQNSLQQHFSEWFITDEPDAGNGHIADYRTTLTEGYGDYLATLKRWVNEYLGLQYSSQVGYNMAVDMQSVIPINDAPECEDLALSWNIDAYRQFSGPANLAGKRVISAEVGASLGQTYQQTVPNLLGQIKRLFAGGVNAVVLHGMPYSGETPETTWPGYTTFTYAWSEMYGRHQPSWDFFTAMTGYLARNSFLFQSGVPQMDLAFYQKLTTYSTTPTNYQPNDLKNAGYTYQYLNPENLALANAYVENGILAPKSQAFKALIVRGSDSMTVLGAERIAQLARDGLPVIFSGGIPSVLVSHNASGAEYVKQALQDIRALDNVHETVDSNLLGVVTSLGIKPRVKLQVSTTTWWTLWTRNNDKDEDYIYVYHNPDWPGTATGEGIIEFQSTGVPYFFNTWTGEETPIMRYTQTDSSTTIPVRMLPEQTIVIGFKKKATPHPLHTVTASRDVLNVALAGEHLEAHVGYRAGGCYASVTTSDGKRHAVKPTSARPFQLGNWTLTIEHWDPPANFSDIEVVAVKHNTTHQMPELKAWRTIEGLETVSGRGYYETTFDWPPNNDSTATGALISFGPVQHTLEVSINGNLLLPLDVKTAVADISKHLVPGRNKVEAVVATTLANVLLPVWDDMRTSGGTPQGLFGGETKPGAVADYGLLEPVVITPYNAVKLRPGM